MSDPRDQELEASYQQGVEDGYHGARFVSRGRGELAAAYQDGYWTGHGMRAGEEQRLDLMFEALERERDEQGRNREH